MVLYDFTDAGHEVDVDLDAQDIALATLDVISGDEVLTVIYKDGSTRIWDADTNGRFHDFLDLTCVLVVDGRWQVDRKGFYARKDSYDDGWASRK